MVFSYDELGGVWLSSVWYVSVLVMPFVTEYGPPALMFSCQWFREKCQTKRMTHTFFGGGNLTTVTETTFVQSVVWGRVRASFLPPVVWEPFQPSVVPWWRVSCAPSLPFPRGGEFYLHLKMVLSSTCLLWCPDSCRLPQLHANVASRCLCAAAVKCPSPSLGGNITIILFLYMGLQKLTGWALVVHHTVVTKIGFYRPFYVCR